jgi:polyhydroxybutyrate depolymerase
VKGCVLASPIVVVSLLVWVGRTRNATVAPPSVPIRFTYSRERAPVIIDLHGSGATPHAQVFMSYMHECARRQGWHVVYPAGVGNAWNAGPGTYPPAWSAVSPTDHVAQLSALADSLRESLNASHVFVTGLSNGCTMAMRLGLEAEDGVLDAVACTSHAMHPTVVAPSPRRPTPFLLLTGSEDPIFASERDVERTAREWARNNGCDDEEVSSSGANATTVHEFECPAAFPVRHVRFHGAGHILPHSHAGTLQCSFLSRVARDHPFFPAAL